MKIVEEFSRFADEYTKHNLIQREVAKKLISYLKRDKYSKILDLGSGNGEVYKNLMDKNIMFEKFIALDFSNQMLALHPSNKLVTKVCFDFNKPFLKETLNNETFDVLLSSSALQWSNDLEKVLLNINGLAPEYYFSFFTANTFRSLHKIVNVTSPIYKKEEIFKALERVFNYQSEVVEYKLDFDSVYEMLRYIKKSGVGGGVKQLSYKEIKKIMVEYPLDYLEFEVVFISAKNK